jgi:hypothetical protein
MSRNDISDFLIHFTRGDSLKDAFQRLQKIVDERQLLGSCRLIKGGYTCVCFSEAPLSCLSDGLVNPAYYSQYSPFGIMVPKEWLFQLGGRPVIYETEAEFYVLPDSHRWRHMRYEPPTIDFSWEREWRIQCDHLQFDSKVASIVVLDQSWARYLVQQHESEQEFRVIQYSMILDDTLARLYYEPFKWNSVTLN